MDKRERALVDEIQRRTFNDEIPWKLTGSTNNMWFARIGDELAVSVSGLGRVYTLGYSTSLGDEVISKFGDGPIQELFDYISESNPQPEPLDKLGFALQKLDIRFEDSITEELESEIEDIISE